MCEINCTATITEESIEIALDGTAILISLDGDIDFTPLAKHLTHLIERKCGIAITWAEVEEPTDKANIAKEVVDGIIESFNQVIEEQFDEVKK
ncbi:MAG: hypothetical protein PHP23_07280 [Desulfobacterales bacterium]|nr:hypothetical protein [Bacteroidales bacterium]MDD2389516.1 hypothetical protein [Desulfobacterales bacterium]MDD4072187.1 hypothetical protein [Desulfobacterales bacterium]MDD4391863.1 hypothetical protein [Desulfobacterales bacterium]